MLPLRPAGPGWPAARGELQAGCKPARARWRQLLPQEATMGSTPAIEKFLEAIETASISGCDVGSPPAPLNAPPPSWRLPAVAAAAILAEYARWFADPGHFDELRRYSVEGGEGEGVEYTLSWLENGAPPAPPPR